MDECLEKYCNLCKKTRPIDEFNWKVKRVKRASNCRACQKVIKDRHYRNNRQKYLDKQRARVKKLGSVARRGQRTIDALCEYLSSHPCVDCGETDILVLEFDHRDPAEKEFCIGASVKGTDRIMSEVAKCDVRCCNCHKRRHDVENNTYRVKWLAQQVG